MPDTQTPNYALWKPELDGAVDYWGQLLNANFDTIDTLMLQRLIKTAGAGQQIISNHVVLAAQPNQAMGDTSAATVGWVESRLASINNDARIYVNQRIADYLNWIFPIYTVVMWRGSFDGAFPPSWACCNGNTYDGIATPNMTDRFVIGAGRGGVSYRGDSGTYEANPSYEFRHLHHSQFIYGAAPGGPFMRAMWDTAPTVENGGAGGIPQPPIAVPYYCLCFLMKTRNVVPSDVG